jgi:hypothetical protein
MRDTSFFEPVAQQQNVFGHGFESARFLWVVFKILVNNDPTGHNSFLMHIQTGTALVDYFHHFTPDFIYQ